MKKSNLILTIIILSLVALTAYSNIAEQNAVDQTKIPEKVELSKGFQKWITNLKNKGFIIEADDFRLLEENEIYTTKTIKVTSIDEKGARELFEQTIKEHKNLSDVEFSPSEREFVDHRNELRNGLKQHEARFYGLRDDKIIDSKILNCSSQANCYMDRAFFLDNDVFVITEFSRNLKRGVVSEPCSVTVVCTYTIKLHLIDLVNNSRLVYESKEYELILENTIPNL
jgi:hypothetical protein